MTHYRLTSIYRPLKPIGSPEQIQDIKYYRGNRELDIIEVKMLFYYEKKIVRDPSNYVLLRYTIDEVSEGEYGTSKDFERLN